VSSAESAPTEAEQREFDKLKRESEALLAHWRDLQRTDLATFQKLTADNNLFGIVVAPPDRAGEVAGHEQH